MKYLIFILSCFSFLSFSIEKSVLLSYFFLFYIFVLLFRIFFSRALQKAIMELQALHYVKKKKQVYHLGIRISYVVMFFVFCLFHGILFLFPFTSHERILSLVFSLSFLLFPLLDSYRSYFLGHAKDKYVKVSYFVTSLFVLLSIGIFLVVSRFTHFDVIYFAYFSVLLYLSSYLVFGICLLYCDKKYHLFLDKVTKSVVVEQKIVPIKLLQDKLKKEKKILLLVPILFFTLFDFVVMCQVLVSVFHYQVGDSYQIIHIMVCFLNLFVFCFLTLSFLAFGRKKFVFPKKLLVGEIRSYLSCSTHFLFSILFFISLLGSFLSVPLWNFVYGNLPFGAIYFSVFSFLTLFIGLFLHFSSILYQMGEWKKLRSSILVMVLFKILFTYPFMLAFRRMVLPVVIGNMVASIVSYLIAILMMFSFLTRKFQLDLDEILKNGMETMSHCFLVVIVLFILSFLIPIDGENRFLSFMILVIYSLFATWFYSYLRRKDKK